MDQRKEMVQKLLAQAVSANKEMELYNPYTSQLLQSCTAQLLLQEQIMKSAEMLTTSSMAATADNEDHNARMESDVSLVYFGFVIFYLFSIYRKTIWEIIWLNAPMLNLTKCLYFYF